MKDTIGPHLESFFPHLVPEGYKRTSSKSKIYNCVAWAMGDMTRWWQPSTGPGIFWPPGVPKVDRFEIYVQVFKAEGYVICDTDLSEPGFEKVALYQCGDGSFGHAAKLFTGENGETTWSSKLGKDEDIAHQSLKALESADYGHAAVIMKRPIPLPQP